MNNNYMCVDESTWEQVSPEMDTITEIPQEYKDEGDELIGTYICKKENMGIFNQIYMLSWILIRKEEAYLVVPCQINYLKKFKYMTLLKQYLMVTTLMIMVIIIKILNCLREESNYVD